jgi:multidrug efflux pump subunit AcrA (membrane-fusion protein)
VVQHQEGGIVRAIRVRDGDRVTQGQELMLLDDVRIDAQLDLLRTQLDAERAKTARLEAERTLAAKPVFPKDLIKDEYRTREEALFRARREALDTQIAVLRKQIRETAEEGEELTRQIAAEERALKLQKEELESNERLLAQGYVQRTR